MATEYDRAADRLIDNEAYRAKTTGFGTTKQGQALALKYRSRLAERIAEDRARPDDREVWRAFIGNDDETLALRLLVAGISVAEDNDIGIDEDDGEKNFRDQALWIGSNFGQRRELGLKVGVWGLNMLQCLPVFGLDAGDVLRLTASADEFMDEVLAHAIRNNALLSPLTSPPEDWTQVRKGGLPADHWAKVPLVREHHPTIEQAVRKAIGTDQMQRVLDAINSLQRVPYCINEPILEFILKDGGYRAERDKLAADKPPIWQKKKFEEWQAARAQRKVFDIDMLIAEDLAGAGRFWVPLNMDFRGRVYGIPHFNFQREDHIRALFLFANGEEIGEDGIRWLKGHVAAKANGNSWSPEKKPGDFDPEKRVAWADDDYNSTVIRRVGEAVLRGDDPSTISWALDRVNDRYQFVAACAELVQALDALEKGQDFITRLPITFDGTCSGLQHMCGMTRAEEGRFVSLTPSEEERGDDFYQRVAFRAWRNEAISISHWGLCLPLHFLMNPFDRGLVKQPAMSYFYGSRPGGFSKPKNYGRWRPYGMTKQIFDELKKAEKPTFCAQGIAHAIYNVIEDMVPRAKALRDRLEELAILCADEEKHLRWPTALRLPVINCYHEAETERIPVYPQGRRHRVKLVVGDKEDVWKAKAKDAAAANFVHSVDAAHLQFVALQAAEEGIDLAVVHDCFGCLASRASRLKEIIPEQFIHLHKHHNLLAGVWSSARRILPQRVKLPPPPEIGDLEIEQVIKSFHAWK